MSDGPHRSLPLPPHWRTVMRYAETSARSLMDVFDAAETAMAKDCCQLPEILLHPRLVQPDLLMNGGPEPGTFENIVIDHIRRLENGSPPSLATHERALASGFSDFFRRQLLSIEEHCHRHWNDRRARNALERIRELGRAFDCRSLANRGVRGDFGTAPSVRLPKRKGLEDGPPL